MKEKSLANLPFLWSSISSVCSSFAPINNYV
jgi:hypothetical protein